MAPVYAFFKPIPNIKYIDSHCCHLFQCAALECKHKLRVLQRFLDMGDAKSTSNMWKHAKRCRGDEVVMSADQVKNVNVVQATTVKGTLDPQLIMVAFKQKGKG